ncbi:hypothetical protein AtubIFM57258_001014 [Aspergillus tubingensis]|nr:hypothetical protein AtubIFM57258_001014 [Aspergillus tubingensis]
MPVLRPGKLKTIISATGALLLICTVYIYWAPPPASVVPSTAFEVPLAERQNAFWKVLNPILQGHAPNTPTPKRLADVSAVHFNATTTDSRPDLTIIEDGDLQAMEEAHAGYIEECRKSERLRPVHTPGTRGIVSTAGASYFPVFLSSLRMLRRLGSTLPVEVYMKDKSEYEKQICDEVLPGLGARCLVLSDIVGKGAIEHYQLKIFAVLFSSFEEVIWMDADCFPLHKPEVLLESEPFSSKGLVTWPDFWISSASPLYFKISRQEMPALSERASSEAGVFLVSKKTHQLTLLLAAYYNYYGPSHYFRLLSQGAPGEGDKETFLHAATAVGEPFYAVSERVQAVGHTKPGGIAGSAMVQTDPAEDYALTSANKWRVKDESVAKAPHAFFIHANYPKFNPGEKVFGMKWETTPTLRPDGTDGRAWLAAESTVQRFGYDVEKAYWEEIKNISCDPAISFRTWERKDEICDRVESYWANVFAEPHEDDPKFTDES